MADNYGMWNGVRVSTREPIIGADNRAFKYGDGLFESIRFVNGHPVNVELHYDRVARGCQALKMDMPEGFDLIRFQAELYELGKLNGVTQGGRGRLQLFRKEGATYVPNGTRSGYFLEVHDYKRNDFVLNKEGLKVSVYDEIKKPINPLSNFKTSNSLVYIMAGVHAGEHELDDCLLLNDRGNIIEGTSSNLFIVSNGVLYTPGLDDGCVGGTMRMRIINLALEKKKKVYECPLNMQNILSADEMFLTNAVAGVRWIGSFRNKRYFNNTAKEMTQLLNASLVSSRLDLLDN